jgi:polysaccharide biosynthesis protein PslH
MLLRDNSVLVVDNCYEPGTPGQLVAENPGPPVLLFAGTLSYWPNSDAVSWIINDIWPALRKVVRGAELCIVGSGMAVPRSEGVSHYSSITNMADVLGIADFVIVPLRYGSGSRIKILEAWASGTPVVSTSLGAAGLGARDGEHLLIADTASEMVRAILELIDNPSLATTLRKNAKAKWIESFSQSAFNRGIDLVLATALLTAAERRDLPGSVLGEVARATAPERQNSH